MNIPRCRRSRRLRAKRKGETKRKSCEESSKPRHLRRRQDTALSELAALICSAPSSQVKTKRQKEKQILFITGAGLSVDSGIRPFRSSSLGDENSGLWTEVIWTTATRAPFRKDPRHWYEQFWNPYFRFDCKSVQPNVGHLAMDLLLQEFSNVKQITQNIDGLQQQQQQSTGEAQSEKQLIEVHGRCGLYKCCPDSDSSDDEDEESEEDDDDNRPVVLGHRRRSAQQLHSNKACPYQYRQSLREDQIVPLPRKQRDDFSIPSCPHCGNVVMPQALLFDEGYHAHAFYEFERAEDWIAAADVICLVGTSCAVQLTRETLRHAREQQIPVFSLNVERILSSSAMTQGLNVTHILGPTTETLPLLLAECRSLRETHG
jgi:NAD-dependent deacetylase